MEFSQVFSCQIPLSKNIVAMASGSKFWVLLKKHTAMIVENI
jgi:hypothetical protein